MCIVTTGNWFRVYSYNWGSAVSFYVTQLTDTAGHYNSLTSWHCYHSSLLTLCTTVLWRLGCAHVFMLKVVLLQCTEVSAGWPSWHHQWLMIRATRGLELMIHGRQSSALTTEIQLLLDSELIGQGAPRLWKQKWLWYPTSFCHIRRHTAQPAVRFKTRTFSNVLYVSIANSLFACGVCSANCRLRSLALRRMLEDAGYRRLWRRSHTHFRHRHAPPVRKLNPQLEPATSSGVILPETGNSCCYARYSCGNNCNVVVKLVQQYHCFLYVLLLFSGNSSPQTTRFLRKRTIASELSGNETHGCLLQLIVHNQYICWSGFHISYLSCIS